MAPSLNINDLPDCLLLEVGAQGPATPHGRSLLRSAPTTQASSCCSALSFEAHFGVRKL